MTNMFFNKLFVYRLIVRLLICGRPMHGISLDFIHNAYDKIS